MSSILPYECNPDPEPNPGSCKVPLAGNPEECESSFDENGGRTLEQLSIYSEVIHKWQNSGTTCIPFVHEKFARWLEKCFVELLE